MHKIAMPMRPSNRTPAITPIGTAPPEPMPPLPPGLEFSDTCCDDGGGGTNLNMGDGID